MSRFKVTGPSTPSCHSVADWKVEGGSMACKLGVSDIHGAKVLPGCYNSKQVDASQALCQLLCLPQGNIRSKEKAEEAVVVYMHGQALANAANRAQQVKDDEARAKSMDKAKGEATEQEKEDRRLAVWTAQNSSVPQEAIAQDIEPPAQAPRSPGSGKQPWKEVLTGKNSSKKKKGKGHKGQ
jgi:hypothetical protein